MSSSFSQRINQLGHADNLATLRTLQRGIERECLRVQPDGDIALTPHPRALGAALTHPHITTDFSEALLEFITPVCRSVDELLRWLTEIHQNAYNHLGDELLWASSMPCVLPHDADIPVAQFGTSNISTMKTVYRIGLGYRYGRAMQTIAGIHYNISFTDAFWQRYQTLLHDSTTLQDFKTNQYLHLIRNFRRYSWLLIYLFGASPAVCKSFLRDRPHTLQAFDKSSLYAPNGTSLRMGDLGYQSNAQENLYVCYNGLAEYAETLGKALTTAHADYAALGTHKNGERIQLNTNLLQIENEFYSSIRPKRVANSGEKPLAALLDRGIEYVEVRCLDVNPYLPLGIDAEQIRFIDAFMLFCLLEDSAPIDVKEYEEIISTSKNVVNNGRANDAQVKLDGESIPLTVAASSIMARVKQCAEILDGAKGTSQFSDACAQQQDKLTTPSTLPAAQILHDMQENELTYYRFAMNQTIAHKQYFAEHVLAADRAAYFEQQARASIAEQKRVEQQDRISFEEFMTQYHAQ